MSSYVSVRAIDRTNPKVHIDLGDWSRSDQMYVTANSYVPYGKWGMLSSCIDEWLAEVNEAVTEAKKAIEYHKKQIKVLESMEGDLMERYDEILSIMAYEEDDAETLEWAIHCQARLEYWKRLLEDQKWYSSQQRWIFVVGIDAGDEDYTDKLTEELAKPFEPSNED